MAQKNCLIVETLNPISVLEKKEKTSDGLIRVSGCFGVCGIMNENGRTYNKENYGSQIKALQNRIANEGLLGELEHPNSMNINLENVSHKIESIEMRENGEVWGTICLANTPKGKIAQAIVEMNTPLYISSRARGRIDEKGNVTLEELKTYDLVGTPGFSQAILRKNQTFEALNESLAIIVENEDSNENIEKNTNNIQNQMQENTQEKNTENQALEILQDTIKRLEEKLADVESKYEAMFENVASYVDNELAPELDIKKAEALDEAKEFITNKYTELVEGWVKNEFFGDVKKFVTEHYSDAVQGWLKDHYSPRIQNWIAEEFAPVMEEWITEHYSEELNGWFEEGLNEKLNTVYEKVQEKIDESLKSTKDGKLNSIDETLKLLESMEANTKNKATAELIAESRSNEIFENFQVVKSMPAKYRPLWNAASKEIKESIINRAKVYNFNSEEVVERFWNTVDFSKEVKGAQQLNENVTEYEKNLRASIRAFRRA